MIQMSVAISTQAIDGITWNVVTVTGNYSGSITLPQSPLRIVGNIQRDKTSNVWNDFTFHLSSNWDNGRLHFEDI